MRIAIVGSGVSGNVCAYLLQGEHEVTLFEQNDYPGGHTHTLDVTAYGQRYTIDTGFMVFNDRTYPNFVRLLELLEVDSQPSDMSFSVHCEQTGCEYQGSSLNGLFAQRSNLINPQFYGMLWEIFRFNRQATAGRDQLDDQLTLGEFLRRERYGARFVSHYLLPMTAAIWSAPAARVMEMPAKFLFQFFHNHGLLQLRNRPQWRTIPGGARRYVQQLLAPPRVRVCLQQPVRRVERFDEYVELTTADRESLEFDAVVFACHADQALGLLADPTPREREVLGHFGYQRNLAVVHTDVGLLPRRTAAWASWNYRVSADPQRPASVTYELNRLQRLGAPGPICVTLNGSQSIAARHVLREIEYRHPVFGPGTLRAQQAHHELNGQRRSYFCGAYWGYGFHEDGVRSALVVGECFGRSLASCRVASIKDECDIGGSCR